MLTLLLLKPDQAFYQREIAGKLNLRLRAVQQVLPALVEGGIITREASGRQVYYRANPSCPILPELTAILLKTVGLADVLREALASVTDRIEVAFVFGSLARSEAASESDVDLMIIGDVRLRQLVPAVRQVTAVLQREINPVTMDLQESRERLRQHDHFLTRVLQEPKIFVVGDEDDLRRIAQAAKAAEA